MLRNSTQPLGSDLLKADRLKAGGMKPGTWALNVAKEFFLKNTSQTVDGQQTLTIGWVYAFNSNTP